MPALSMRRPLHSAKLLASDRSWLLGFAMETSGFLLYAAALALASLALVQSINAGGIGVLAYVSARMAHRRLRRAETVGVLLSVGGLVALAISLVGGSTEGGHGSIGLVLVWLGASARAAAIVLALRRRVLGEAVAYGIAGGIFFSIGDIATKL